MLVGGHGSGGAQVKTVSISTIKCDNEVSYSIISSNDERDFGFAPVQMVWIQ